MKINITIMQNKEAKILCSCVGSRILLRKTRRIYERYKKEFGDELDTSKVKRIIPFIY